MITNLEAARVAHCALLALLVTACSDLSNEVSPDSLMQSAAGAAVLVGAGDIATCGGTGDEATAALLDDVAGTVFTTGDNAYPNGSASQFADCYDPSWGRHKARTRPAPGNHEYETSGAAAYFDYFGAAAGEAGKGYYSYDLGTWHVVVLNGEVAMGVGSAQLEWLAADLTAHPVPCTLAYWHEPRFSSGSHHGSDPRSQAAWDALYDAGAEVVVNGHEHQYERFRPQTPAGVADAAFGIREFVVGTGGADRDGFSTPKPNSMVRDASVFGVIKFTLRDGGYDWAFLPVGGGAPTDAGSGTCHGRPGSDVVVAGAGNIAKCTTNNDEATAQVLDRLPGFVVALGDNAFPSGRLVDYQSCYGPTWGRHQARTFAVLGNHEYDTGTADGTWDYFGDRAGPRGKGYYSTDLGTWHVVVLNDRIAMGTGSAQLQWLVADLDAHPVPCTLALWHAARFLSSDSPGWTSRAAPEAVWEALYAAGADVVWNGQEHDYERMAPMDPAGQRDDARGIRQFNVGTGGESLGLPTAAIHPNSDVLLAEYGVLDLTLRDGGYDWVFLPVDGAAPADAGQDDCH